METFQQALKRHRTKRNLSHAALARLVGVDASYITRIENGQREPPKLHFVEAIARALMLNKRQMSEFIIQAGYCPPELQVLMEWPPGLQRFIDILVDPKISEADKTELEEMVWRLCRRWSGAPGATPTS